MKTRLKVTAGLTIVSGLTYLLYAWISSLPRTSDLYDNGATASVEIGDKMFWGKGRCHVCHRIGDRGYALRGPNLGDGPEGAIIPTRARTRAKTLGHSNGTEYLVQSILEPGAFIVPRYQNEMPKTFEAPVALNPLEIKSIVKYLQSLDGDTLDTKIELPKSLFSAIRSADQSPFEIKGDIERGRQLFYDLNGPAACSSCHVGITAEGERQGAQQLGPDLSALASIRTGREIYQKILNPDSYVVSGYDQTLIRTQKDRLYVGMIAEETPTSLVLSSPYGAQIQIPKSDIAVRSLQPGSAMPSNYAELLSARQLDDLMAYLLTLRGE
jgi:putative heme-binding domain-containing protein